MNAGVEPAVLRELTSAEQERFRFVEAFMSAFRDAPVEVLRHRGIIDGGIELPRFRGQSAAWFLEADDATAVRFFLLVQAAHAASEAAIAAESHVPN